MNVFVTGHRGYVGAQLVALLKAHGARVTGCDLNLFEGCAWDHRVVPDREIVCDVRAVTPRHLAGHDCVMHLAAISNDPMGELDPGLTDDVNAAGSVRLAAAAKAAGVTRFLLASSCSLYGRGAPAGLNEDAALDPVSAYAASKIRAEREVSALADAAFSPTYLRAATAFGYSPMLRIDIVANNLLACALAHAEVRVRSDGMAWRPFVSCTDFARAFIALMTAPRQSIHDRAVNIGADAENYRVREVAEIVGRLVPAARIVFTGESGRDRRDYKVDFARLAGLLPDFRLRHTLETGLEELRAKLVDRGFRAADFDGDRFVRLRMLRRRLSRLNPPGARVVGG